MCAFIAFSNEDIGMARVTVLPKSIGRYLVSKLVIPFKKKLERTPVKRVIIHIAREYILPCMLQTQKLHSAEISNMETSSTSYAVRVREEDAV